MDIRKQKRIVYTLISLSIVTYLFVASVLLFCSPNQTTQALTNTSSAEQAGDGKELWLSGAGKFNGDVFEDLTNKLFGTQDWATYIKTMTDSQTESYVIPASTINAKIGNGTYGMVVQLGGLFWTVASLTLTNDSKEDVVATLYLANSTEITTSYFSHSGTKGDTMYSRSILRKTLLQDDDFALFADDSNDDVFASKYLVQPKNIKYQTNQTIYGRYSNWLNMGNEALGEPLNGKWNSAGKYSPGDTYDNIKYEDWGEDRIWIPSFTETGATDAASTTCIWKLSNSQRVCSKSYWLRSGARSEYKNAYYTKNDGSMNWSLTTTNSYVIRPAIHLNLTQAAENISVPTITNPTDVKKYYSETDGVANDVTFELKNVFIDKLDVSIKATDMDGQDITSPEYTVVNGVMTFKASQVGKYVVTVKPKDKECWEDGTNGEKTYTYYLKYHVTPMRFASDVSNLVYKATKQYIAVENYDEEFMTVTPSTGVEFERIPSGENAGEWGISATNAGEGYKVTVALKNTEYMEWTDNNLSSPKSDLTFSIAKKTLNVTAGSLWSTEVYTSKEYELTLDCADEDIGKLRFDGYYKGGSITTETKVDVQPVMSSSEKKVTVKLPRLSEKGEYIFILKLAEGIAANGNYILKYETSFTVGNKKIDLDESEIVWRYANANIDNGAYKTVGELDDGGAFNVEYNGTTYSFEVNVLELSEDIRDSIEYEYIGERSGVDVKVNGSTVENYTITFKIKAKNGNTSIDIVRDEYTLKWKINKALVDLSNVKWDYTKPLKYNDKNQEVVMTGIPNGLTFNYKNNRKMPVGVYTAEVISITLSESMKNNYIRPEIGNGSTYKGEIEWTLEWEIEKGELELDWERKAEEDGKGKRYWSWEVSNTDKVEYLYYTDEGYDNGAMTGNAVSKDSIEVPEGREEKDYWIVAVVKGDYKDNYEIKGTRAMPFTVGSSAPIVQIDMEKEYVYDGSGHGREWYKTGVAGMEHVEAKYYKIEEDGSKTLMESLPTDAGRYEVRLEIEEEYRESYQLSVYKIEYEIVSAKIKVEWNTEGKKPEISGLSAEEKEKIEYEYYDESGKKVEESEFESGNTYKVVAKIKEEYVGNYEFVDGAGVILAQPSVSGEYEFEYKDDSEDPSEPDDPNNPNNPINPDDPTDPENPNDPTNPDDGDKDGNGGALDEILAKVKDLPLWQLIASVISIILTIAFLSKTASNESKRKKTKKVMEKKYNTFYASAFLGLSVTNWTVIASVLMGVAVLSLVFMIISQKRRNKAEEELEDAKEEYARNREEMLYMRMSGNNGNMQGQGYAYAQPAIGIEDMRGMINEAVSAMLPNVQQYLPQQASVNEELVQKLIEQNAQNEERIRQLTEQNQEQIKELTAKNNETIKKMSERNDERIERFLQKLTEQKPVEKTVEKEVAATVVANDEIIKTILQGQKEIMERLSKQEEIKAQTFVMPTENPTKERVVEYDRNSEKIEMLMRNQEILMQRMNDLAINTALSRQTVVQQPAPQIVEKEVRVEVPVEKIVEKEVVKEVKVEVPVEKPTAKVVPLAVEKPAPKARVTAPRLTLDEAYAKLSAKQKKFFDTLKEYAMSKDKCKEKKSTYYILLGQSSVNPLVKLTIKKDCTVALFKMEDEYMKDIRRNATNDGTKVKVKETELIVGDAQALATAKEMIDLREDQIERYNDFLKEQRSLKKR